ncbi:MAG: hypothetical protein ABIR62_03115 [Dokdonella sp.]|uniref:hypothetical protein n=1 Tax=Dokdonella sp. TaxID=2291710 RepID=UPI003264A134
MRMKIWWLPLFLAGLCAACSAVPATDDPAELLYGKTVEQRVDGAIVITWRGIDRNPDAAFDERAAMSETSSVYMHQHPTQLSHMTTMAHLPDGSVVTTASHWEPEVRK